jgi:hypothetical protein
MTHEQVLTAINACAADYSREINIYQLRLDAFMKHGGSENEIAWAKEDLAKALGAYKAMDTVKCAIEKAKFHAEEMDEFRAHLGRY